MFAKYDLDGDRVLDETEQRKMQADLDGQKVMSPCCQQHKCIPVVIA